MSLRNPPRDATFEIVVDMSIRALWIVPIVRQSTADLLQDNIIFTRYCVLLLQPLPLIIKPMFIERGRIPYSSISIYIIFINIYLETV